MTGCSGVGTVCPGDAFLVGTGRNSSSNNIPMDKKAFSPRVGFAYGLNDKTVVRAGFGVFFIPNYVSFGLNPDNDVVNLASTPFHATTDGYILPFGTLDGASVTSPNCAIAIGTSPVCDQAGPFGSGGILLPPGRNPMPNLSSFVASNGNPTLAPYFNAKYGYVEQYNFDIQRQLPAGFFADVAFAGSRGVHLQQYSTNVNQIGDSFVAQAASQFSAALPGCSGAANPVACANTSVTIDQTVAIRWLVIRSQP